MFAISPKLDCPHYQDEQIMRAYAEFNRDKFCSPCGHCSSVKENWMCFECKEVFCSRFVEGHMAMHNETTRHPVAFSFSDGSAWCYECDSYVYSNSIREFAMKFQEIKFGESKQDNQAMSNITSENQFIPFEYNELITGIKSKQFKKIAVLTGAGISVAAGIPDFRTPGTGLYSRVAKLGLPYPEAVFNLDFFRANPYPYYQVRKEFLLCRAKPVSAHHFIKRLNDEGQLMMNYSQNIDDLELDAGLPLDKLVQAHGHMRTAHCIDCRAVYDDINEFNKCIEEGRVCLCPYCNPDIGEGNNAKPSNQTEVTFKGLIKPDTVFFGEALPTSFHKEFTKVTEADLVIVMGTSLKVYPFAFLLQFLSGGVPVVLINRENPGIQRDHFLFLEGDIQEIVERIARDLDWTLPSSK